MAIKLFVDTNVILRYILQDSDSLYEEARAYIEESVDNSLILTPVIVAEVIYVLLKSDYSRQQVADTVRLILNFRSVEAEDFEAVSAALQSFVARNLDFADCYILERSVSRGLGLATQDKKLLKIQEARNNA